MSKKIKIGNSRFTMEELSSYEFHHDLYNSPGWCLTLKHKRGAIETIKFKNYEESQKARNKMKKEEK